jgi:hypothetical protein
MTGVTGVWDKLSDWAWMILVFVFGWAWRINDRVIRLEMEHKATTAALTEIKFSISHVDSKLDKLMDKLP